MKTFQTKVRIAVVTFCLAASATSFAQIASFAVILPTKTITTGGAITESRLHPSPFLADDDDASTHLDNAVAALNKGDKSATSEELNAGIAGLEGEAQKSNTSFKDKILAQVSKLKALLPLISTGALSGGTLSKAVSLAKLASGGNQLEGLLSAGSLIGKGSQLTSGLTGISSALGVLGGSAQSSGSSLVSTALASVGKLNQGGLTAKAAEPAAKTQVNSVLNFVKGVL